MKLGDVLRKFEFTFEHYLNNFSQSEPLFLSHIIQSVKLYTSLTYLSSIVLAYSNIQLHDCTLCNICTPNRAFLPNIADNPFIDLAGYPGTPNCVALHSFSLSTVTILTESACLPEGDERKMLGSARQLSRSCQLFPAGHKFCVASDTVVRTGRVTLVNLTSECIFK